MHLHLLLAAAATAHVMPAPLATVSSVENDYNIGFDAQEQVMVFARSKAEFKDAKILISERTGKEWSEPAPIGFSNALYADSDPWLTPDGSTLYFISDRPHAEREEGRKDYDIWRSRRTSAGWSEPERLGSEVNSRGQELGPELHGDTLYFSSARRSGLGGLDIYAAKAARAAFETATLLPGPFNSSASDSDFTLSADGKTALLWRSVNERGEIHISYLREREWSQPQSLGPRINIGPFNFTPSFAPDGKRIRYASTRERSGQASGYADIFEARLPN